MQLDGVTALVTGGTAGIGREIALQLAKKGARVLIAGRNREAGEAVMAEASGEVRFIEADLGTGAGQAALIARVTAEAPDLALLVNNAGIQVNMPSEGIGDAGLMDAFRAEIELNLTAPIALSFGLMPLLARRNRAAIVNISSGLALSPKRTAPVYCATKSGLGTFSRALRYRCEDAAPALAVQDVLMAFVDTAMTAGRGRNKMPAAEAARQVIAGIERGSPQIFVGKARLLALIARLSPALAYRILRNG